ELRERHRVGRRGRVGGGRGRKARLGEASLEREDLLGRLARRRGRHSGEGQGGRDVRAILLTRLREARLRPEVVLAVGQPQATGRDVHDDARRVVMVRSPGDHERGGDGQLVQAADHPLDARAIPDVRDVGEQRDERGHTHGVDRGLVHAGREVIAEQLLDAAAGPVRVGGELPQQRLQLLPVRLTRGEPPAPASLPGGNGVCGTPRAVGERMEVGACVGRSIDVADLDALRGRPRGGWRGCGGTLDATDETRGESDAPDEAHDASGPHGLLLEEAGTSTAATTAAVSTMVANSPWRSDRAIAWISSARYSIPSGPTRSNVAVA